MHKIFILLFGAFLVNTSVSYAKNALDSIGVENNNGKKLILHKVDSKETYYAIARKYNVGYKDIMTYNDNKFLQPGIVIKVPTALPFAENKVTATNGEATLIEYTIKAKDNLNLLAERYGTTVNEIKRMNNLNSINLQIGQVLKIPTKGEIPLVPQIENQPIAKPTSDILTENTDIANISHSVKAKENLNLIAQKYGTTVEEIKRLNGLKSNNLSIGQVLKIKGTETEIEAPVQTATVTPPVQTVAITTVPKEKELPKQTTTQPVSNPATTTSNDGSFEHIVTNGETIYSISKKYNLTTYQLKSFNNLPSNEVSVGQKLLIKGARPVSFNEPDTTGNGKTIKDPSLRYAPSSYGLVQVEEKGTAVWIADQDLDPAKMLVLHRTAPVGTIIKVTNPMSNRSAFAKVVGKYTENESTKDVIIVMTKAVADAIGALDKRFYCNLTYGAQENEQ
jgi:peptidoglycan endopeptidase LytF